MLGIILDCIADYADAQEVYKDPFITEVGDDKEYMVITLMDRDKLR